MGGLDIDILAYGQELKKIVAQVAREVLTASNQSDTLFATYTGNGLKVDNKPIEIDMDFVEVPEHLKKYKVKVSFDLTPEELQNQVLIEKQPGERVELSRLKWDKVPVTLEYDKMEPGQRYLVQQKAGSQKYIILDRVPEE